MPVTSGYGTWAWRGFGGSAGDREKQGGKKRENGRERGKRKTQEFIKPPQSAAGTIGVTGEQRERGENEVKSNLESGNPG